MSLFYNEGNLVGYSEEKLFKKSESIETFFGIIPSYEPKGVTIIFSDGEDEIEPGISLLDKKERAKLRDVISNSSDLGLPIDCNAYNRLIQIACPKLP